MEILYKFVLNINSKLNVSFELILARKLVIYVVYIYRPYCYVTNLISMNELKF